MSRSWIIAIIVALGATAWMASGQFFDSDASSPLAETSIAAEDPLPQVRVRNVVAEPMIDRLTLQGRTAADRTVEVRAETTGLIEEVLAARGARVRAGNVLVRLAVEDRQARLAEARALLAQREIEFEAATKLNQQGYRADTALAEVRAGLDAARAQVELAELELRRTVVKAPFAGIVNTRPVEVGGYVSDGDVVATVVDLDPIRVVGRASERYLGRVQEGGKGSARLLDGTAVEGTVTYIGAVADADTRTFPVELTIPNPDGRVIENVTAEISLPVDQVAAHQLPPSALTLADDGVLGVKAVGDDGTVAFHAVRVLGSAPEGIWVGGLPESLSLITVGHEFVLPGQRVDPVPADRLAQGGAS